MCASSWSSVSGPGRGTNACIWLFIAASPRAFAVDSGNGFLEAATTDVAFAGADIGFGLEAANSSEFHPNLCSYTASGTVRPYGGSMK